MVRFCARVQRINEIPTEVTMHLAPLGHELEIHIWSEMNKLADALSRVAESGVTPDSLGNAREAPLAKRGAEAWTFLKHLKGTLEKGDSVSGHSRGPRTDVCLTAQKASCKFFSTQKK